VVVPQRVQHDARAPLLCPLVKVFAGKRLDIGQQDHRHDPLVVRRFANPLQFVIITNLVGALALRKAFAGLAKGRKPVFAEKKPVDLFAVVFGNGKRGVKTAHRKLIG
jgi:hypothetical protein